MTLTEFDRLESIRVGLRQNLSIAGTRLIISSLRGRTFCRADARSLLRPALIHAFKAPFDTLPRRANRAAADNDEHWIRVSRAEYPQSDPAARGNFHLKAQLVNPAIGGNFPGGRCFPVDR